MPRLKSRTKHPPYDFQLLLPEIGMKEPITGSFDDILAAFRRVIQKNPGHAQRFGWPLDPKEQANFLDEREAQRCLAHGWTEFVDFGGTGPSPIPAPTVKKNWREVAAAVVSGGKSALFAYNSMFGPGGKPVARELAEQRAAVCLACPQNDTEGGLLSYFTESAARGIMGIMGALRDLDVRTSVNDKLGVCKACLCPLQAKVFVPADSIQKHLPANLWPTLSREPLCWILREANRK
jgi:hypothetical protein